MIKYFRKLLLQEVHLNIRFHNLSNTFDQQGLTLYFLTEYCLVL